MGPCAAGDFSAGDLAADVILRAVGVDYIQVGNPVESLTRSY